MSIRKSITKDMSKNDVVALYDIYVRRHGLRTEKQREINLRNVEIHKLSISGMRAKEIKEKMSLDIENQAISYIARIVESKMCQYCGRQYELWGAD